MTSTSDRPAPTLNGSVSLGAIEGGGAFRAVATFDVDDEALWRRWRDLERRGSATPFQTTAVARPLLTDLARAFGARPFVVEVHGAGDRHVLSLGLVARRASMLRRIEFPDFGLIDHNAPVWSEDLDTSPRTIAALREAILAALPAHDALVLAKMPPEVGGLPNPLAQWPGTKPMSVVTMAFDPSTRPAGELSGVKDIERRRRKLVRNGGGVDRVGDIERAHRLLDFALDLREEKARRDGRHETIADPAARRFYHAIVANGFVDGTVRIWEVTLGERTIAMLLGLFHAGRFHAVLIATDDDPRIGTYSPGLISVGSSLLALVDAGGGIFDLGPGEHPYKRRFGTEPYQLVELSRARTPLGLAVTADRGFRRFVRTRLRRHPTLRARLYRMLGWG
jgi:CelD/BcsL family acetyltransferase involved in cellulose biosynthesis